MGQGLENKQALFADSSCIIQSFLAKKKNHKGQGKDIFVSAV